MYLETFALQPIELQAALTPGGVGRFMSERKSVGNFGLVDDQLGNIHGGNGQLAKFVVDQSVPGLLIIAKDRNTMLRGLLTRHEVVSAVGLGVVAALVGSYSAPVSKHSVMRTALYPLRQPASALTLLKRGIPLTTVAGTNMSRGHLKDRGFFVLLSGRTALNIAPPNTRLSVLGDYEVPLRDVRRALPPE